MPGLDDQAQLADAYTADFAVVRALLARGRTYEQAVRAFEPYREIQEPSAGARAGIIEAVAEGIGPSDQPRPIADGDQPDDDTS